MIIDLLGLNQHFDDKQRSLQMVAELTEDDWIYMYVNYSDEDWVDFFESFTERDWNDWFASFGDEEWAWFFESMKDGEWNDFFAGFDEEYWSWWFGFLTYDDFTNFCEEVNDGEWNDFFDELEEEATEGFIFAWDDEMWGIAKDTLDEEYLEAVYEVYFYAMDDDYSFVYDISEGEWSEMSHFWNDE